MKKLIYIFCLPLLLLFSECKKEPVDVQKAGVSLPGVTNLVLVKLEDNAVRLTWAMPTNIPEEIQQPLSVYIEVNEITGPTKAIPVFSVTLPDAPTTADYEVPDATKKYLITVKVRGTTKVSDVNYSSNIYSLGQTVTYN
jgi:hypothetical protein